MKELSSYIACCFSLKSIEASPEESQEQPFVNGYRPLYRFYREQHGWADDCTVQRGSNHVTREKCTISAQHTCHIAAVFIPKAWQFQEKVLKVSVLCNLLGFSIYVVVSILLECDSASLGDWYPKFRDNLVVSHQRTEKSNSFFFDV
jgi:hypothetical protein